MTTAVREGRPADEISEYAREIDAEVQRLKEERCHVDDQVAEVESLADRLPESEVEYQQLPS